MITRKLREVVQSMRRRPPTRGAFIVGKRMLPEGCECVVSFACRSRAGLAQRRCLLRGLFPGDVVRTASPPFEACGLLRGVIWRRGEWKPFRRPPCAHFAECPRCPWIAADAVSGEWKAEKLRRALTPLLDEAESGRWRLLEPFSVPFQANALREVEFAFSTSAAEGAFVFAPDGLSSAPGCVLWTLEQQRLLAALNRWAGGLTPPLRRCLRAAFILQHPDTDAGDRAGRSWEAHLQLTLLLRRDVSGVGPQSPLCAPSQPDGTLSLDEKRLVEAVLAAAPLTPRVGVATLSEDGAVRCLYPIHKHADFASAEAVWASAMGTLRVGAVPGGAARSFGAALPFAHTAIAAALGARDLSEWERPPPSPFRHPAALSAVGGVLLSLLAPSEPAVWVWATRKDSPQRGGAHLLATALSEWLADGRAADVWRVGKAELGAPHTTASLLVGVLHDEADGTAVAEVLRKAVAAKRTPRRVLLLQLEVERDFEVLSNALNGVRGVLRGAKLDIKMDAGVVDVDPWTAATVGYTLLDLSPHTTPSAMSRAEK